MKSLREANAGEARTAPIVVLLMSIVAVLLLASLVIGDATALDAYASPPPDEEPDARGPSPAVESGAASRPMMQNGVWI